MNHMNGKTIGILATAAVLAIVAAVALNSARKPATENSRETSYAIPELRGQVNDVKALVFTGAEGKTLVTLVKAEKGWRVKEKGEYPADTGKLRELLLKLADAALVEPKTSNEQRYAELGVDDPAGSKEPKGTQVTIEGLSKPVQMIIGTPSSRGDGTFVRRVGDKQSWLAKGDLTVEKDPSGWLERDLADISASRVAEVTVNRPNGKIVRIYKEGLGDANFKLADLPKGRELNSDDSVHSLAAALAGLVLEDVAAAANEPAPDPSRIVRVRYRTVEGLLIALEAWRKDDKAYAQIVADVDQAAANAHIASDQAKAKAAYEAEQRALLAKQPSDQGSGDPATQAMEAKGTAAGSAPPAAVLDPAADRQQRLDAINAEAATLKARLAGWTFVLPVAKLSDMERPFEDYLKPLDSNRGAKKASPKLP